MPATSRRRIVRRAVMALVGAVLLPVWYVGTWLAVSRATHDGLVSWATAARVAPVFALARHYSGSELPGSRQLRDVWWSLNPPGRKSRLVAFTADMSLAPCDEHGMVVHVSASGGAR